MDEFIGKPVRSLQTILRGISFLDDSVPHVVPDGIFGQNTEDSLKAFQRSNALPQTGKADLETWNALRSAYKDYLIRRDAEALMPYFYFDQKIMPEEENDHMFLIRAMLIALSQIFDNVPFVEMNGIHGDDSVAAIKWFQNLNGITPSGIIDIPTWRLLAKTYRLALGNGAPENRKR